MDADEEGPRLELLQRERISQRLYRLGIHRDDFSELQRDVLSLVEKHKLLLSDIVYAILPSNSDVSETQRLFPQRPMNGICEDLFDESALWLQWLMLGGDPKSILNDLAQKSSGQRRVCGAVWGSRDLAYRCRTCEQDPTCAICVLCFQNGNHEGHDYSIIHTGGGCCDCGDITAWKRDGFCSKHKGTDQIHLLSEDITCFSGPVLDALFLCWKDSLSSVSSDSTGNPRKEKNGIQRDKYANELSSIIVKMLLEFCSCCESLLSFVAARILLAAGLLELLVRAEMFLSKQVVKKLHELLLKLLGEPLFKQEFAISFVHYYPVSINKAIEENANSTMDKYPLLSFFSVQIFTVPTLTPRLVLEENLLGVLFQCLWNIFQSCAVGNGCLEVSKWANMYKTTIHLLEEIRYVMSHEEVPRYAVCERPDIIRCWFRILQLVQGIGPLNRITGLGTGDENEDNVLQMPFGLALSLWNVQKLLVDGTFSLDKGENFKGRPSFSTAVELKNADDGDYLRLAKVGRLSQERSVVYTGSRSDILSAVPIIPPHVTLLVFWCMKYLDNLLAADMSKNDRLDSSRGSFCTMSNLRARWFWTREGKSSAKALSGPFSGSSPRAHVTRSEQFTESEHGVQDVIDADAEKLSVLNMAEWPKIVFDVSSQEISFHIPMHRLLGFLLQEAMERCYGEGGMRHRKNNACKASAVGDSDDFFMQALGGFHPLGFSSFVMEHPLRLRVFCAQVHAGMWRRNNEAGLLLSYFYHCIHYFEIGVEPDLFLLQCCAALSPADVFVKRIMERFDLSDYLSLDPSKGNTYEVVLIQEMLKLIIQIITQRRFCGLSTAENLCREIVHKLAVGDATRSQLVESLPRDLSESPLVQDVIDTVATYSNPSGLEQGRYSLKAAYWTKLDLYHPRWRPRDMQRAEERFQQFCKSSALHVLLPRWTHVFDPLISLSIMATSKVVLLIIRAVLFYAAFANPSSVRRTNDGTLLTSLHLLSLALDVCEKHPLIVNPDADSSDSSASGTEVYPILRYACEKINAEGQSLLSLLVYLMFRHKDENNANHGDSRLWNISSLIECLIKRFAQLNTVCMNELKKLAPYIVCDVREKDFEKKLQRSASDVDHKARARERQAAILEKMRAQQSKFIASMKSMENDMPDHPKPDHIPSKEAHAANEQPTVICSFCKETDSKSPLCFLIHLQKSRLSSFVDRRPPSWNGSERNLDCKDHAKKGKVRTGFTVNSGNRELDLPFWLCQVILSAAHDLQPLKNHDFIDPLRDLQPDASDDAESFLDLENQIFLSVEADIQRNGSNFDYLGNADIPSSSSNSPTKRMKFERFGPSDCDGIHISSCGHAVHRECHDLYLISLKQRQDERLAFEGMNIADPKMDELLCPVCRRFANSILPIPPRHDNPLSTSSMADSSMSYLPHAVSLLRSSAKIVGLPILEISSGRSDRTAESALDPILGKLCKMYYPHDYDHMQAASSRWPSFSLVLWDTVRYSVTAAEIACRGRTCERSEGSWTGLEALYSELRSSDGFITSLLLQVARASRSVNCLQMLIRFAGIKLFEAAMCSNVERDKDSLSSIMKHLKRAEAFPDILFLKQASDPILGHDPFQSLMWLLFCLPHPFALSQESFTALVHLFYVVCVIQGMIACHISNHDFSISSHVDDLCRAVGGSEIGRRFFLSGYFDAAADPREMIRRLTFPYLRRCSLLWKMINSSMLTAPCFNKSAPLLVNDINSPEALAAELGEISELEASFHIPPLEAVLGDKIVFSLVSKWCAHFLGFVAADMEHDVLYSTPAVPFSLMRLPRLYQDLLQRYVKQKCPDCNREPGSPALCLLCGKLCSARWKKCCEAGECQRHAAVCGAGIGVFLLVMRTTVLLQRSARQGSWPSLYLDAFGEEDDGMHRGRPLYLSEERFQALSHLVASHGFDRSSSVHRYTTLNYFD